MKRERNTKGEKIKKRVKPEKKDENQEREIQSLFMREKEVKKVMLARQPMYLLMPHDYCLSSIASTLPIDVEELLKEFGDVITKDTPHRLPPLRRIKHQIDLIPGASLPNKPTYRSNLEETKEIQRQVESLMEKGWVREILSPCVMPVILVNQTLSQLLRYMLGKNLKAWEECLPYAEFAYNKVVNSTISYPPFEVVYGFNPLSPLDLLPFPNTFVMMNRDELSKANFVKSLPEKAKAQIEKKVEQYAKYANKGRNKMVNKPGDWVWIHLGKNRFNSKRKYKLGKKGDGHFQVLKRINYNAYKIALPLDYGVNILMLLT